MIKLSNWLRIFEVHSIMLVIILLLAKLDLQAWQIIAFGFSYEAIGQLAHWLRERALKQLEALILAEMIRQCKQSKDSQSNSTHL